MFQPICSRHRSSTHVVSKRRLGQWATALVVAATAGAPVAYGAAYTNSGTGTINLSDGFIAGGTPIPPNGTTVQDSLIFSSATASTQTDDLFQSLNANVLTFSNTAALTLSKGNGTQILLGGVTPVVNLSNSTAVTDALNLHLAVDTTFQGTGTATLSGTISGASASLTKTGTSTLILSGVNTYAGGTTLSGGTLNVNSDASLGIIPSAASTNLTFTASSTLAAGASTTLSANRNIAINGAVTAAFNLGGNTLAINGSITTNNAGAILTTVAGNTGTLILAGSNNFFAGTTLRIAGGSSVNGGIIRVASSSAFGANTVTIDNTSGNNSSISVLELTGGITVPSTVTYRIGGHNNPVFPGLDLLRNVSGKNAMNGLIDIVAGGGGYTIDSADPSGTLTINGNIRNSVAASTRGGTFAGPGNGALNGVMLNNGTAITNATFQGTGTWTVNQAANSYTGGTTISAGVVEVSKLAAGGVSSSIGASGNTAGNLTIGGSTLRYIGSSASTTDRLFTVAGGTAVTVEASGTAAANTLSFTNTGAIAFSGTNTAQTFTLGGTNAGVNTFAPTLGDNGSGITSLTKAGSTTWTLSGANSYTGATTVTGGTLRLDFSAANAPAANIINNASNTSELTLAGGNLELDGKQGTANTQQFANLNLNQGYSQVVMKSSADSDPLQLSIGNINRAAGGTVDFAIPTGVQNAANGIATSASNNSTGIIGGYATVLGTDWAAVSGTSIVPYAAYTALPASGGGNDQTNFQATGSLTLTGPISANSLKIAGTAPSQTLVLGGNNLTIAGPTGGILFSAASGTTYSVTGVGGTISAGANELIVFASTGATLSVSAVITGSAASGSIGLTKSGPGTLSLAAANTYTGDTLISGGTLRASVTDAIPNTTAASGNVIVSTAGTLAVSGSITINGLSGTGTVVSAGGASTLTVGSNNAASTFSGTLQDGTGTLGLTKVGTGITTLSSTGTYTGPTSVTAGTLRLTTASALGNSSGITVTNTTVVGGNGTSLDLAGNVVFSGVPVTFVTSNTGGSKRTNFSVSSGAPVWAGPVILAGNDLAQFNTVAGSTLTINGPVSAQGGVFSGIMFVRGAGTGIINGQITLPTTAGFSKTDGGTWNVNAAGNSWGPTAVAVGTLRLGAAGALPPTTALTMGQGDTAAATLDLNGYNQTVASLALNSGATGAKTITSGSALGATLTVNSTTSSTWGNATSTTNLLTGTLGLTKTGSATLTLSGTGTNTYTGITTILNGALAFGTANRLPDNSPVALAGGTLATAGFSDVAGPLSVTANSTIDLGTGASILKFALSSNDPWTGTLSVANWSGDPLNGGGTDQLFFGNAATGITNIQLSQINFVGFQPGATILSSGEIVPAPEPTTLALAAVAAVGLLSRRRRATSVL